MKPYYDDGKGIVIYHGDCREILPTLPKVDLVLTDPPWLAMKQKIQRPTISGVGRLINEQTSIGYGTIKEFDASLIELAWTKTDHDILIICGFKELGEVIAAVGPIRGCFVWHKPNGSPTHG